MRDTELKRFLLTSIRIIALRENIQRLREAEMILIKMNSPIGVIVTIRNAIKRLSNRKEWLKSYAQNRFEVMLLGKYAFDSDDFKFLTRKDIKKGYVVIEDEPLTVFVLTTGKIISLTSTDVVLTPSPIEYFKIIWPF